MTNKLILAIAFFGLAIGVVFGAGLLINRQLPARANASVTNQANGTTDPSTLAMTQCVITVDGQRYDVADLRNAHSGGDVFQCGTDMSAVFHGQHGDNLRLIQPYLVK